MAEKKVKKSKLEKLLEDESITEAEAITAIKGLRKKPSRMVSLRKGSGRVKYGYLADTHIGHEAFLPHVMEQAVTVFNSEGVDFIVHAGDHVEGMSGRPGHIYELTHIGFTPQINEAVGWYSQFAAPMYGIDGNHDQWYFKKNNGGVVVGEELSARLKNYTHLGQDEGQIQVARGLRIDLFHGNDGTAYADSYKIQKLIESFEGGKKPSIVHSGHYHKQIYVFRRNVHGFESGTLCGQSRYMRGKKIQAHIGFGVVDVAYDIKGVTCLTQTFYPGFD